jgi:hypothetical protein
MKHGENDMKVIKHSLVHNEFYTSIRITVENLVCDSIYNSISDSVWDSISTCISINNSIQDSVERKIYER